MTTPIEPDPYLQQALDEAQELVAREDHGDCVTLVDQLQTKVTNLEVALSSRDTIGMAKGILMATYRVRPEQAFEMLVLVSQHSHIKVAALADELVATGTLPHLAPLHDAS